ncbi:MAG: 50S ribosomal protein L6 [Nanoarchaeota archaeon]
MVSKQEKAKKEWTSYYIEVELEGTTAIYENGIITIKGPKGEISKKLRYPNVSLNVEDEKIIVGSSKLTQREKKIINTYRAHITNLIKGVNEGFEYKLVVVFAKFPMTIEKKNQEFIVKNLLGEKVPRVMKIPNNVELDIKGKEIFVRGIDKELVGQCAANIEQLCRITHLDRRVIQDGIFITNKPHRDYV